MEKSPQRTRSVRCPQCDEDHVSPSHSHKPIDIFMRLLKRAPMRCRTCGRRFFVRVK